MPLKVIVVGAGIAGLATAIGLARTGHDVEVYEKRRGEHQDENGAGIQPQPGCVPILVGWDMLPEIRKVAFDAEKVNLKSYNEGIITTVDFHLRGPMFYAPRGAFKDAFAKCAVRDGAKLHYGAGVVDVDVEKPSITLEGGKVVHADLIVGADGYRSRIREALFPDFRPQIHSMAVFQVALPLDKAESDPEIRSLIRGNQVVIDVAPGRSIFICPSRHHNIFDLQFTDHEYTLEQDPHPDKRNERIYDLTWLKQRFTDHDTAVKKALNMAESAFKWRLVEVRGVPRWSSTNGKIVLAGDSVHGHTPFAGQGSGQGVENGAVLAELLKNSSSGDDLTRLLETYEKIRRPRCETMQKLSLAMGGSWTLKDKKAIAKRNEMWRLANEDPTAYTRAKPNPKGMFGSPEFTKWLDLYNPAAIVDEELNRSRL